MNKIHRTWKRMRNYERTALVVSVVVVAAIVVLEILNLMTIITMNMEVLALLMALLMFSQTVQQWRKNRKPALLCLFTAVMLVFLTAFIYFFV